MITFVLGFSYADKEYEVSLDHLENNTATPVDMSTMDPGQQERSKQLYSILIGSLRGRPLRILKGVGWQKWFRGLEAASVSVSA